MPWINRIIALALIVGAIPLWRMAGDFPSSATAFPRAILVTVASLAIIILVRGFVPAYARRLDEVGRRSAGVIVRPLAVFAATAMAVLLMPAAGFFPAVLTFAALLYPLLGVRNLRTYVVTVGVLLAFVYTVFGLLLGVPLGAGRMVGG